jgi:mono/diheme cytochrome c family protein
MKWQIVLGTVSILALVFVLSFIALNEEARMADFTQSYQARQIETGAALFENNCRSCHGPQGKGIEGVAPSINAADLYDGSRLENIGWSGTVEDFLLGVIAAGRPVPTEGSAYPQRMPTWGQEFGGPLRADQVESLVGYVMNWEERALLEADGAPVVEVGETVGTEITIALPQGDVDQGQSLAEGSLGCSGCHVLAEVGPGWLADGAVNGIGNRAVDRIAQSDYTGEATTAEQYLIEAVVQTNIYLVEGFQEGLMPGNYGERLSPQDLADLIAYMFSLN